MERESVSQPVLDAVVRDVRTMATMLRAIAFTPLCQITMAKMGIQVITEVNGVIQATAYLSTGLFASYYYKDKSRQNSVEDEVDDYDDEDTSNTVFEVSLSDLLVCLNIYGNAGISVPGKAKESEEEVARRKERDRQAANKGIDLSTEMRLLYHGSGSPLILQLQEGSTKTRCELTTYIANTALLSEMTFLSDEVVGSVIMQSKDLMEAIQSIDTSTKQVTFSFLNNLVKQKRANNSSFNEITRRNPINGAGENANRGADGGVVHSSTRGGSSSIVFSTADDDDDSDGGQDGVHGRVKNGEYTENIQMLRIKSQGDSGSSELDFPNQHKVFEQFASTHNSSTTYQFVDIQRCLKAFQTSTKTSIRIDEQGMMSLQCLFPRKEPPVDALVDVTTSTKRGALYQTDPETQGFVDLKILPINFEEDGSDV